MKKKKLILLMNDYPYGKEEKSFIEPEIPYLLEKFELTIVSTSNSDDLTSEIDETIRLYHFKIHFTILEKILYMLKFIIDSKGLKEICEILHGKEKLIGRIRDAMGFYGSAEKLFKLLKKNRIINKNEINNVYSYWCNANCLSVILHKKDYPCMKIISRLHGCDLYEERNYFGRQPFRTLVHQKIDKLIFVSEEAMSDYLRKWNTLSLKHCDLYKLGIINKYEVETSILPKKRDFFLLVSCSHIITLKRIDLLIHALSNIDDIKINWVHFGEGEERENIEKLAKNELEKKENIKYTLIGHIDNKDIMEFYAINQVDCFITTSNSEGGCPVSIQEALSFGIPIVGISVGGVPSMIKENGILLPMDAEVINITNAIRYIAELNDNEMIAMKMMSRKLWQNNFNAEKNSVEFVNYIEREFT